MVDAGVGAVVISLCLMPKDGVRQLLPEILCERVLSRGVGVCDLHPTETRSARHLPHRVLAGLTERLLRRLPHVLFVRVGPSAVTSLGLDSVVQLLLLAKGVRLGVDPFGRSRW